jgi:hypothetical protein
VGAGGGVFVGTEDFSKAGRMDWRVGEERGGYIAGGSEDVSRRWVFDWLIGWRK